MNNGIKDQKRSVEGKKIDLRDLAQKRKLRNRRYCPQKITRKDYERILKQYEEEHEGDIDYATKQFNAILRSLSPKKASKSVKYT